MVFFMKMMISAFYLFFVLAVHDVESRPLSSAENDNSIEFSNEFYQQGFILDEKDNEILPAAQRLSWESFEEQAPPSPENKENETQWSDNFSKDNQGKPKIEDGSKDVSVPSLSQETASKDGDEDVIRETCVNKVPYAMCSTEFLKRKNCDNDGEFNFYENCQQYCEFCVPDLRRG